VVEKIKFFQIYFKFPGVNIKLEYLFIVEIGENKHFFLYTFLSHFMFRKCKIWKKELRCICCTSDLCNFSKIFYFSEHHLMAYVFVFLNQLSDCHILKRLYSMVSVCYSQYIGTNINIS
jgi:hypothetical protein